jgi:hypothetical protein
LKDGAIDYSNFFHESSLLERDLEESVLCPSNADVLNVKRILYCPGNTLTASDLVRGRRLQSSLIERTFDLIKLAGLGTVSTLVSKSNRNKGV